MEERVRQPSDSGFLLACVTSILFPHQKSQLALTVAWPEKDLLGKQGLRQVEAASALTGQGVTGSRLSLAAFIQTLGTGSTHNRCSSGVCSALSTKLLAPFPSPETMTLSG